MALLFNRLAHNFVKNGYYPTDSVTLSRIQNLLAPSAKPMRLLDPCCGEGTALAGERRITNLIRSLFTRHLVPFGRRPGCRKTFFDSLPMQVS